MVNFKDPKIAIIFENYPPNIKQKALEIRAAIFEIAAKNPQIGEIEETLKWGEPAFITTSTKSGSTIRIDKKRNQNKLAVYFICKTTLIEDFKTIFGDIFTYEGNRALIFDCDTKLPMNEIKTCLEMALTYQLRGKLHA